MNQSNSFTYSFDPVDLDFAKQTVLNLVEKNEKLRNQLKDANKIIKNLSDKKLSPKTLLNSSLDSSIQSSAD